jgi:AcrR family transcriptional regulator
MVRAMVVADKMKRVKKSRSYMNKAERKIMIARAATSIFAKKGYHKTSIEDICNECKIAQGTLYLHFSGKLEVFRMAVIDALTNIQELVKPINISSVQDQNSLEHGVFDYLNKKNLQIFNAMVENKNMLRIVFREAVGIDEEINKLVSQAIKVVTGMVETELSVFKSIGLIREIDTKIASIVTVGTMQMVMQAMFDDDTIIQDIESLAVKITELQVYGTSKSSMINH